MARRDKRVYPMSLPQFEDYIGAKLTELNACRQEIDQVRVAFEEAFRQELEAWQERFSYCYPLIKADRTVLPSGLQQKLDLIEREEDAKIRAEIVNLQGRIKTAKAEMDRIMAEGAQDREALRAANPRLNEREEDLKAKIVSLQNEYAALYEQEERLRAKAMGWLAHAGKLRRLKREQKACKKRQTEAIEALRQTRTDWVDRIQNTSATQAELSAKWQAIAVETAQDEARLSFLSQNTAELAEQNAIQRLLEELEVAPEVPGELGRKLAELVEHNHKRAAYEQGMADVSLSLGLMKGIGDGLSKLKRSVSKVVAEQRRYNLAPTQVPVPASVAIINQTWKYVAEKVRDEKAMGQNPLAFSELIGKYVSRRLDSETIERFFEDMGAALNRATRVWG